MKILRQFCILLVICLLGEFIHKLFKIPIPGNVIGMIILFVCLFTGIIKLEMIADISKFLLDNLAFFFIPAGVGLINSLHLLQGKWLEFFGILLITTIIVIVITGHSIQIVKKLIIKGDKINE